MPAAPSLPAQHKTVMPAPVEWHPTIPRHSPKHCHCSLSPLTPPPAGKTLCQRCQSATGRFCRACLLIRYGETLEEARERMDKGERREGPACLVPVCMHAVWGTGGGGASFTRTPGLPGLRMCWCVLCQHTPQHCSQATSLLQCSSYLPPCHWPLHHHHSSPLTPTTLPCSPPRRVAVPPLLRGGASGGGLAVQQLHLHEARGQGTHRHRHLRGAAKGLRLRGALAAGGARTLCVGLSA